MPNASTPNTSTAVPMNSVMKAGPVLRIAGPGGEARELGAVIRRDAPVGEISEVDEHRAGESTPAICAAM
ncbi:MAG: hypothetical protein QM775_25165 [Pirellulales bacterium]